MHLLQSFFRRYQATVSLLLLICIIIIITTVTIQAAYRVQRPITTNGGIINQTLTVPKFDNPNPFTTASKF